MEQTSLLGWFCSWDLLAYHTSVCLCSEQPLLLRCNGDIVPVYIWECNVHHTCRLVPHSLNKWDRGHRCCNSCSSSRDAPFSSLTMCLSQKYFAAVSCLSSAITQRVTMYIKMDIEWSISNVSVLLWQTGFKGNDTLLNCLQLNSRCTAVIKFSSKTSLSCTCNKPRFHVAQMRTTTHYILKQQHFTQSS